MVGHHPYKIRTEPHPIGAQLGQMLRERRQRKGWDQRQLADKIGVSQSCLDYWEKGRSVPRFDRAMAWAEALGYDLWPSEAGDS